MLSSVAKRCSCVALSSLLVTPLAKGDSPDRVVTSRENGSASTPAMAVGRSHGDRIQELNANLNTAIFAAILEDTRNEMKSLSSDEVKQLQVPLKHLEAGLADNDETAMRQSALKIVLAGAKFEERKRFGLMLTAVSSSILMATLLFGRPNKLHRQLNARLPHVLGLTPSQRSSIDSYLNASDVSYVVRFKRSIQVLSYLVTQDTSRDGTKKLLLNYQLYTAGLCVASAVGINGIALTYGNNLIMALGATAGAALMLFGGSALFGQALIRRCAKSFLVS